MAFREDSTGTYTFPTGSSGSTVDLGARNTYRYVNAENVKTTHTGTYTLSWDSDFDTTKDLGVNHTYRYISVPSKPIGFKEICFSVNYIGNIYNSKGARTAVSPNPYVNQTINGSYIRHAIQGDYSIKVYALQPGTYWYTAAQLQSILQKYELNSTNTFPYLLFESSAGTSIFIAQ